MWRELHGRVGAADCAEEVEVREALLVAMRARASSWLVLLQASHAAARDEPLLISAPRAFPFSAKAALSPAAMAAL